MVGGDAAVVSLDGVGSVMSRGESGTVVVGGCCTSVTRRLPPPTWDETVNRPAITRTVNVAATTTAAPMTPAPTTKALPMAVRLSPRPDVRRAAVVRLRPSAYPDVP